jgi:DNA primase
MRLAIALLIQYPELVQHLDENVLINFILPGGELLKEVTALLKQMPNLNTGILLENWRERVEYSQLSQLAAWDAKIPKEGIAQEFLGILASLEKQNRETQIELLLQKANLGELNVAEKTQLQNLIAANKN